MTSSPNRGNIVEDITRANEETPSAYNSVEINKHASG